MKDTFIFEVHSRIGWKQRYNVNNPRYGGTISSIFLQDLTGMIAVRSWIF